MLDDTTPSPLPPQMRSLLLDILAMAYPAGAPQTRLSNAPDGAIAWQVQSMLDDHADADARFEFVANDNFDDSPGPDDGRARAYDATRMGIAA